MPIVVDLQKLTDKATTGALKANAERVAVALLGPSLRSGAFSVSAKVHGCESTLLEFAVQYGLPELTTALIKENADVATKVRVRVSLCACVPQLTPPIEAAPHPSKAGPRNRKITPRHGSLLLLGCSSHKRTELLPRTYIVSVGGGAPLFSR